MKITRRVAARARLAISIAVLSLVAITATPASSEPQRGRVAIDEVDVAADGFRIRSLSDTAQRRCLDVDISQYHPVVQTWECHDGANQRWHIWGGGDGTFVIYSVHNGQCIDGFAGKGQQVQTFRCDGSRSQEWWLHDYYGHRVFENAANNLCLDIVNWGHDRAVQLWDCHYDYNQIWYYD
jgi:Ricin-type beta-trefoil lectin domain